MEYVNNIKTFKNSFTQVFTSFDCTSLEPGSYWP